MSDNYIRLTKVPDTDLTRRIRFVLKSKHRMSKFRLKLQNLLPSYSFAYVVVQFYPWFKFYFPLFQTHYHTLPYPKTKGNKI